MVTRRHVLTINAATCSGCGYPTAEGCLCGAFPGPNPQPEEKKVSRPTLIDDDDDNELAGYRPAVNSRPMEPIPTQTTNWAELSPLGGEVTANVSDEPDDDDGLVVNENENGGLPTFEIDYAAISKFRPKR